MYTSTCIQWNRTLSDNNDTDTFWSPKSNFSVPKLWYLYEDTSSFCDQDTLTCSNGVHNRVVPLYTCMYNVLQYY